MAKRFSTIGYVRDVCSKDGGLTSRINPDFFTMGDLLELLEEREQMKAELAELKERRRGNKSVKKLRADAEKCGCINCAGVLANLYDSAEGYLRSHGHARVWARQNHTYFIQRLRELRGATSNKKHN